MKQDLWNRRASIVQPYDGKGLSAYAVAKATGLTIATVKRYAEKFGFDLSEREEAPIEEIRRLASEGFDRHQVADQLGLAYQTIVKYALAHDIEFRRKKFDSPLSARNRSICDRYLNGEKQIDLAEEFGVSRERVRQIIERAGLVSETKRHEDYMAVVAGTVVRKGFTIRQAAEYFGISRVNVYSYCVRHGVTPARMTAEEQAELDALALQVVSGKSIRQAAKGEHHKAERLRRHLANNGINAKGRSRWDDFSERKRLLTDWRTAGLSWQECAVRLSKHDGRKITGGALVVWCRRHMPHLIAAKKRVDLPKGVTVSRGRFMAQISLGGRSKYLGMFDTPEEAHRAYLVKLHESRPAAGGMQ